MSKLVTFEQATKLKELGFHNDVLHFYKDDGGLHELEYFDREWSFGISSILDNCNYYKGKYNAPYIHEALEWFREVIGIECEVCLRLCFMGDSGEAVFGGYEYIVFDHNTNKTISSTIYHNRNEAESALLDALIEYVSK